MMPAAGFPPIAGAGARLLILGTLPGRESLARAEYYAQARNAFWPLMGELCGAGRELPYAARTARMVSAGIAVWDVCAAAIRHGSLDAAIEPASIVPNDFLAFFAAYPGIRRIACNGRLAAQLYARLVRPALPPEAAALEPVVLPSTSPAYAALSYAAKRDRWRVLAD